MKRSSQCDADELSVHLNSVSACLLRVQGDVHSYLSAGRQTADSETEAKNALMASSAHLLRTCLHMYNALEEGLNYLDDAQRSLPQVDHARELANQLLADVAQTERLSEPSVQDVARVECSPENSAQANTKRLFLCPVQALWTPVSMLRNTLDVLLDEMSSPRDEVMAQRQQLMMFGTSRTRRAW